MRFNFAQILTIIFFFAKILGYIDWSWWLVFLPLIIMGISNIPDVIELQREQRENRREK